MEIVYNDDRFFKLLDYISFRYFVPSSEYLVALHKTVGNIKLDKFNSKGFSIFEKTIYVQSSIQ